MGWNQFQVLVVDLSRTPEQVVQFYKVSVFRQRRSENEKPFVENVLHQVCSQVQVNKISATRIGSSVDKINPRVNLNPPRVHCGRSDRICLGSILILRGVLIVVLLQSVCDFHDFFFNQDCDLKVYSSKSCGLQRVKVNSWKDFIEERLNLPTCKNGHEKGIVT